MPNPTPKSLAPDELTNMIHAIGTICINWAFLEQLLAVGIWHSLGLEEKDGQHITDTLDISVRAARLHKLSHLKFSNEKIIIKQIMELIEEVIGERNLAVHGLWSLNEKLGMATARVSRGKFKHSDQPMTLGRLTGVIRQIEGIYAPLQGLLLQHGAIEISP